MAHDNNVHFPSDWCELVQCGEHEDRSFSHAGFGLADDIEAEDGLGDALMLD